MREYCCARQVCEATGIPCRVHVGRSNSLSTEEQDAESHGAELVKHADVPFLTRIAPRAEADAAARGWTAVPFGVDCDTHLAEVRRQVCDIPSGVRRVVIAVRAAVVIRLSLPLVITEIA